MKTKTGIEISFTPLGFNPHSEQVCFVGVVKGKNGQETFNYSGGYLAFIPATRRVATSIPSQAGPDGKKEVKFDLWATLENMFKREGGWHTTNIESVMRGIRQGRIKASKNVNDANVMRVFHAIARFSVPQAEGLLSALVLDSTADGMTFSEWCREYGYDDDSIKAEGIYRACVDTARKLQRILSREQMAEAEEIAANY